MKTVIDAKNQNKCVHHWSGWRKLGPRRRTFGCGHPIGHLVKHVRYCSKCHLKETWPK